MKILKRPDYLVFDTNNPNQIEWKPILKVKKIWKPLWNHTGTQTEYEFLKQHFKDEEEEKHPIFYDFRISFFHVIEK